MVVDFDWECISADSLSITVINVEDDPTKFGVNITNMGKTLRQ